MSFDVFIHCKNTDIQSCVSVGKTAAEKQNSKYSSNAEKRIVNILVMQKKKNSEHRTTVFTILFSASVFTKKLTIV